MRSSKKGNQWYFGMKAHVGVDARERAGAHRGRDDGQGARRQGDGSPDPRGRPAVYGDKGYASEAKKRAAEDAGVLWAVKEKAKPGRKLTAAPACPQSPLRQGARQGRAHLPRREMPVRLSQGALSRHRQERRAGVLAAWRSPICISPAADLRPHEGDRANMAP